MREYEFDDNIELMKKELKSFISRSSLEVKTISLQVPEGLKRKALEIASQLEKEDYDVVLTTDPCWGACDLRVKEAEMVDADIIIHVGHKKFIKHIESKIPIMYFLWKYSIKYDEEKISHELMKIKERNIGLICSVQYQDLMPEVSEIIKKIGKNVEVGGAVLGCWTENADRLNSQAVVYVGSGNFHAIGAKCKYVLDMENEELREITDTIMSLEKKKYASIEKARDASVFAIIVSSKPGQFELDVARDIKKKLQNIGKKSFILIMDEITDIKLMGIDADVFVNTACVRIRDDYFSKPVLNPGDVDILLGE